LAELPRFRRCSPGEGPRVSVIGRGECGGKASGLLRAHDLLETSYESGEHFGFQISVPRMVVIGTDVFRAFLKHNRLDETLARELPDNRLAQVFQKAELPAEFVGDLRALVASFTTPLAVRSSSLLEDATHEPFAGVYETKMIPNNQPDVDNRFRRLSEAIKFVYASTFFADARSYRARVGKEDGDEAMAVIVQEVVGAKHYERFYPDLSGVARSYSFYAAGKARPEDGVVSYALGLGKTIVDGGNCWTYSPAFPRATPPITLKEQLDFSQTDFWAVNLGKPPAFDPTQEAEYLSRCDLNDADYDNTLARTASTYLPQDDRLVPGLRQSGPRLLNFAPLLQQRETPINDLLKELLDLMAEAYGSAVEMEFAVTFDPLRKAEPHFGFLQVRPMLVTDQKVSVSEDEVTDENVIVVSHSALGNGVWTNLHDVVYVKPEAFKKEMTPTIAQELHRVNRDLTAAKKEYILIGFGRWGSSDRWLGIPVDWATISGARVLVEATLPDMNVELSQGSHFFHNLTSLEIPYLAIPHEAARTIDWEWLDRQPAETETEFVRHIRLDNNLTVKVDGRSRTGIVTR
jgi:hypothetical protein